jgi:hypothetical protein
MAAPSTLAGTSKRVQATSLRRMDSCCSNLNGLDSTMCFSKDETDRNGKKIEILLTVLLIRIENVKLCLRLAARIEEPTLNRKC